MHDKKPKRQRRDVPKREMIIDQLRRKSLLARYIWGLLVSLFAKRCLAAPGLPAPGADPDEPIHGDWYWVRRKEGREFFPAKRDVPTGFDAPGGWSAGSAGGWTNEDTWEDFYREVVEWYRIPWPKVEELDATICPSRQSAQPPSGK